MKNIKKSHDENDSNKKYSNETVFFAQRISKSVVKKFNDYCEKKGIRHGFLLEEAIRDKIQELSKS